MKNKLFRKAFWAMCMGFTIPMTLFVVAKLRSGHEPLGHSIAKNAPHPGSLQGQLNQGPLKKQSPLPSTPRLIAGNPNPKVRAPIADANRDAKGAQFGSDIETDAEPDEVATLGPRLPSSTVKFGNDIEIDPAPGEGSVDNPNPLKTPASRRPRAEIIPEALFAAQIAKTARIESQLDQILGRLDRLVISADERPAPGTTDRLQQATDLLQLLQQARQVQNQAAQLPELSAPITPREATRESARTPPAATSSTRNTAQPPTIAPTAKTPKPSDAAAQSKIFRPRYLGVKDLANLVTPMLTTGVGRIGAVGADQADARRELAGDLVPAGQALLVHDTPLVLRKVDRLLQELDHPPERVVLEATVVSVRLNPSMPAGGVNLAEFNSERQPFSISLSDLPANLALDSTRRPTGVDAGGPLPTQGAGLKSGILRGDAQAFLQTLKAATQVRSNLTTQSMVFSRQLTEVQVGEGASAAAEGPRPKSPGFALKVRPIVTPEGGIYLEIGALNSAAPSTGTNGPRFGSAFGNHLLLQPGESAVVGGFISEHAVKRMYRRSGIGDVPLVGGFFRGETSAIERTESIVILTPRLAGSHGAAPQPLSASPSTTSLTPPPKVDTARRAKPPAIVPVANSGSHSAASPVHKKVAMPTKVAQSTYSNVVNPTPTVTRWPTAPRSAPSRSSETAKLKTGDRQKLAAELKRHSETLRMTHAKPVPRPKPVAASPAASPATAERAPSEIVQTAGSAEPVPLPGVEPEPAQGPKIERLATDPSPAIKPRESLDAILSLPIFVE